jgi:hypothetical protein
MVDFDDIWCLIFTVHTVFSFKSDEVRVVTCCSSGGEVWITSGESIDDDESDVSVK